MQKEDFAQRDMIASKKRKKEQVAKLGEFAIECKHVQVSGRQKKPNAGVELDSEVSTMSTGNAIP